MFLRTALQILLVVTAVLAKTLPSNEGLIYIGNFDENDYFVSPNAGSWSSGDADCRNQLGGSGHLVGIETEAEWQFLQIVLGNYGFGTTYWTSGMFDPSRSVWRWTKNNQEFEDFSPWGPGFPSGPNTLLRVLIYYTNRYDNHWRTVPSTQLHRYVCEVQHL